MLRKRTSPKNFIKWNILKLIIIEFLSFLYNLHFLINEIEDFVGKIFNRIFCKKFDNFVFSKNERVLTGSYGNNYGWSVVRSENPIELRYILFSVKLVFTYNCVVQRITRYPQNEIIWINWNQFIWKSFINYFDIFVKNNYFHVKCNSIKGISYFGSCE